MTAVLASTRWGPMLVPPFDEYVSQALIRLGQYAPTELDTWIPYLPAGGIIVDAGANIGAHTLAFALAVGPSGTVIAVEPQRMLNYMLCGTIALNAVRNVHVKLCALGREPGQVFIPAIDYGAPGNFGGVELKHTKEGDSIACVPLDGWKLQQLDFLKVDVEGMELDVLHGASETIGRCRPVISVEADREKNVPATLTWLRLNGYRAWWHRPALGALWPRVVSINLLALPRDREGLPDPVGDVEVAIE